MRRAGWSGPSVVRTWSFILLLIALLSVGTGATTTELVIVHQNDFHGHLAPFDFEGEQRGGLARIARLVDEIRKTYGGRVLWLDGGDTMHGTTLANAFDGEAVVDAFNAAGLDAMAVGNHDFNYGQDVLTQRVDQAAFAVLSANVVREDDGASVLTPYTVIDVDSVKVGIIGLTTPSTVWATHPKNVHGIVFEDPVETVARLLPQVKKEADLVVLVTHIGHDEDRRIARLVQGIDVIVGGHSHSRVASPVVVGDTIIVQANEYGKYLGFLRLVVENGRVVDHEGRLIPITADQPAFLPVQDIVEQWEARLTDRFGQVVSHTTEWLEGERDQVRTRPTNLGYLVAESMRKTLDADVGIVNGGSIRASIAPGELTYNDVYGALPFDNVLVGLELTGASLHGMLEHSFIVYPDPFGGFLQTAGLSFTLNADEPVGRRIQDVHIGHAPLEENTVYKVATSDFLAAGGDGYDMLLNAPRFFGSEQSGGLFLRDVLIDYLEATVSHDLFREVN